MSKFRALFFLLVLYPPMAQAQVLDLSGYQDASGAISTGYGGDTVDTYFATKALLTAGDGGMKMHHPAMAWIKWALSKQRPDGRFDRYKRDAADEWHSYTNADADDASLAVWLQLLYRLSPANGMPHAWQDSARRADAQLQALYDPTLGIYHISKSMPVGLLMDNVEIYSAFIDIAQEQKRLGQKDAARIYNRRAALLNTSIVRVFRQPATGEYLVSTQARSGTAFYPDQAAQVFPLLYQLHDGSDANTTYSRWVAANGKEWLRQRNDDYPWGLVAVTALTMNDAGSASCWQNSAEPMRYSKHWNVLEEAALQRVKWQLSLRHESAIPCVGKDLL